MYIVESKLNMLSPTGRSRMWDIDADGYARGEGVASVVLKTLSAALEDNDHIDCIIRETGINQDGRTAGLTMPSGAAQADLIRQTYLRAGLDINDPRDRPQFFHAHGTVSRESLVTQALVHLQIKKNRELIWRRELQRETLKNRRPSHLLSSVVAM